jgi:hypothetical protein
MALVEALVFDPAEQRNKVALTQSADMFCALQSVIHGQHEFVNMSR